MRHSEVCNSFGRYDSVMVVLFHRLSHAFKTDDLICHPEFLYDQIYFLFWEDLQYMLHCQKLSISALYPCTGKMPNMHEVPDIDCWEWVEANRGNIPFVSLTSKPRFKNERVSFLQIFQTCICFLSWTDALQSGTWSAFIIIKGSPGALPSTMMSQKWDRKVAKDWLPKK